MSHTVNTFRKTSALFYPNDSLCGYSASVRISTSIFQQSVRSEEDSWVSDETSSRNQNNQVAFVLAASRIIKD